jgi:hypothetical protein
LEHAAVNLWRFNPITGFWRMERACTQDTAQQWLDLFRADEPTAHFALSHRAPRFNPSQKG